MKRIISLVIALALCGAVLLLPGCDWFKPEEKGTPTTYPYVFVHGLNGFGDDTGSPVSYWGATGGPLLPALTESQGVLCFAPSVNPMGSAWDRACELYAALTGTVTDYGAAHSAYYGHERYGRDYGAPLFPDWGTVDENNNLRKVNLIAHSFGGATARLLCALLYHGAPEEAAAQQPPGQSCSALFTGDKGDWVFSLTCIAAPHNGTSLLTIADVNPAIATAANWLSSNGIDEMLANVGLTIGNMSLGQVLQAAKTMDTAYYDLTLEGAKEVNLLTRSLCPEVYLFSYPVDGMDNGKPASEVMALLKPLVWLMGTFISPENGVDDAWRPNDGLVNTISATYPFDEPSQKVTDPAALTPGSLTPAVWYVMPTTRGDHGSVIGLGRDLEETTGFYGEMVTRIDALSRDVG